MTTTAATGTLVRSSGASAGSKFELGAESIIGLDESRNVVVTADARSLRERYARIALVDGSLVLERLAAPVSVTVNGVAVGAPVVLERLNVIGIGDEAEWIFRRSVTATAPAAPRPVEPPPSPPPPTAPPPPAAPPPPPAQPVRAETVMDAAGFGALPQLARDRQPPPAPLVSAPAPAPAPLPSSAPKPELFQTMADVAGFGQMPMLTPRGIPKQRPPEPLPPVPAPTPPPAPPARPPTAPPPPAAKPIPIDADGATVFFQKIEVPPPFVLTINLPDTGPTTYSLKFGDNVLGRGVDADVCVPDPMKLISRKHAILRINGDHVELVDLQGSNGTFVKGKRIESVALDAGASFVLGPHLEFTLRTR